MLRRRTPIRRRGKGRKRNPSKLHEREPVEAVSGGKVPPLRGQTDRQRELRAVQFDGGIEHDVWLTKLPCVVSGKRGTVPAHVVSRGAGGRWFHQVQLTPKLHAEQHLIGIRSFEAKYGVKLLAKALELASQHMAEVLEAEFAKAAS